MEKGPRACSAAAFAPSSAKTVLPDLHPPDDPVTCSLAAPFLASSHSVTPALPSVVAEGARLHPERVAVRHGGGNRGVAQPAPFPARGGGVHRGRGRPAGRPPPTTWW